MFQLSNVSIQDWIAIATGLGGLIAAWLQSKNRLPSWARKWMNDLGEASVLEAIEAAKRFDTPAKRRSEAVEYLQRLSMKKLGFRIPTSVANLLIEYVYQQWKRRT